jgi:hypothetical protein
VGVKERQDGNMQVDILWEYSWSGKFGASNLGNASGGKDKMHISHIA